MGVTSSTHSRSCKWVTISTDESETKEPVEDLGLYQRIILKYIVQV
jgi:hypothetical protein